MPFHHTSVALRSRLSSLLQVSGAALCCLASPRASATYSIVAADRETLQVGGAGTSCIGGADVYIIYGSAPGTGAVHAQAQFSAAGRNRAVQLLGAGQSPEQIISAITAGGFDGNAAARQYGVVDVTGRSAGFTGGNALPFADDVQGTVGTFTYSVQGNILTSDAVLTQARSAFEAPACDLASRLMAALETGAANGEGDSRCTDDGIPSDSAYLQVDVPDAPAGSFLSLRVPTSGNDNPLPLLRAQFDAWRLTSPCPSGPADAGAGDAASDASPAAPDASSGAPDAPEVPDTPPPMETSGAGGSGGDPAPGAAEPSAGSEGASRGPDTARRSRGGCSAGHHHGAHGFALALALCAVTVGARRRRSS